MNKILSYSLISLLLLNVNILADDFDDEFSDEEIKVEKVEKKSDDGFSFYGSLSLSSSYNYAHDEPALNQNDFRGLGSAKLSSNINFEKKFGDNYKVKSVINLYNDFIYDLKEDDYPAIPNNYESGFDINELYLQGKIGKNIDFRVGRQIVVWGKSDNIRVTDVLNPIDNTTPAMVDIKDLRLGRMMSKVDFYANGWAMSGIILHENRFTENPKAGSEFRAMPDMPIDEPDNSFENSGVAVSVSKNFTGQDLAFYYANQYLDKSYLENGVLNYERSNMFGVAYNRVIDSFLFKTELAYFDNIEYNSVAEAKKRVDLLVGLEYNGISDGSVSFEVANRHIIDYDEALYLATDNFTNENEYQYAVRFTQSYINQTLDFTILATAFGEDLKDGGFVRSWVDYAVNDKISTTLGVIDYIGGDKPSWESVKNNDKVFATLKYNF